MNGFTPVNVFECQLCDQLRKDYISPFDAGKSIKKPINQWIHCERKSSLRNNK